MFKNPHNFFRGGRAVPIRGGFHRTPPPPGADQRQLVPPPRGAARRGTGRGATTDRAGRGARFRAAPRRSARRPRVRSAAAVRVLRTAAVFPGPSMARCCWLSLRLIGAGCAGLPTGSERSPAGTPLLTSSCWDSATFPAKPGFIMCVCTAAPAARSGGGKGARTKKREGGWRELKKIKTQGSSGSSGSNEGRSGATFQRITHGGS